MNSFESIFPTKEKHSSPTLGENKSLYLNGRVVVAIDNDRLFAGDMQEFTDKIVLTDAVCISTQQAPIFSIPELIENPNMGSIQIQKVHSSVVIPKGSVSFLIPVWDYWGVR